MTRRIPKRTVSGIRKLRAKGWSLPELKRKYANIGYGTIYRYIQGVEILPKYKDYWEQKQKTSVYRKQLALEKARSEAKSLFTENKLTIREKLIILSSLYWAEGHKNDFSFTNSDPEMIKVVINCLVKILRIEPKRIRLNIRIYEDMEANKCTNFWLKITGLKDKNLGNVNILYGKKQGKLKYGMCRVRVLKGSNMLKYITAIKENIVTLSGPRSSTDRTRVS